METLATYLARKNREIDFLDRQLRTPLKLGVASSAEEVIARKLTLRVRQISEVLEQWPDLTETHFLEGRERRVGPWILRYLYQRFDLAVEGPPVYPGVLDTVGPLARMTVWHASGMGAIASALLALDRAVDAPVAVVALEDIYFETLQLLGNLPQHLSHTPAASPEALLPTLRGARTAGIGAVALLLDGITVADSTTVLEALQPGDIDVLLFDTTCYPTEDPRIGRAVAAASRLRVPFALLRSHVKLDHLGIEYGRLGSAVFAVSPLASRERQALHRALVSGCRKVRRLVGASPVPQHLLPYAAEPELRTLNRERLARLVDANRGCGEAVQQALGEGPVHVEVPHHGTFLTLEPWGDDEVPQEQIDRAVIALRDAATARGLPVRRANSFGFDFVAVTGFMDLRRHAHVVRVAVADLPEGDVASLSEVIAGWTMTAGDRR